MMLQSVNISSSHYTTYQSSLAAENKLKTTQNINTMILEMD